MEHIIIDNDNCMPSPTIEREFFNDEEMYCKFLKLLFDLILDCKENYFGGHTDLKMVVL